MTAKNPALLINISKIRHNARIITTLCRQHGIQVAAVTKGFCAIPEVAEAMVQGGCTMLADSRIRNLRKLREKQFDLDFMLLRAPMMSEVAEVVRYADISLNSEIATIQALDQAAKRFHTRHRILLMIDVGDLREGIWPDTLKETVDAIVRCEHILLEGIGCNLGCYGGILSTPGNMQFLLRQREMIETTYPLKLPLISGGSTCGLQMLLSGTMPDGINHFRVGEGILLGRSTTDRFVIPDTYQDTFIIRSEIIECNWKPTIPIGRRGLDGFGNVPEFDDQGIRRRAILAVGQQDVMNVYGLIPRDPRVMILGATSDHLIVDITDSNHTYRVGDRMEFYPDYGCMLTAATSEYVTKELR
jgi:predicted amino acid racemase